jgi:hypothetical protein
MVWRPSMFIDADIMTTYNIIMSWEDRHWETLQKQKIKYFFYK